VQARALQLTAVLDSGMAQDHPRYEAVRAKLQVLEGNPGWPQERKLLFARHLLKSLA
jgi:hypothetical protein